MCRADTKPDSFNAGLLKFPVKKETRVFYRLSALSRKLSLDKSWIKTTLLPLDNFVIIGDFIHLADVLNHMPCEKKIIKALSLII